MYFSKCGLAAALAGVCFAAMGGGARQSGSDIAYSPASCSGYTDIDGSVHFIQNGEVITFDGVAAHGSVAYGRVTPDRSRYLILFRDKTLMLYPDKPADGVKAAEDVEWLLALSDAGCYYQKKAENRLYFYEFSAGKETEIEVGRDSFSFSQGWISVAGKTEEGELFVFSPGDQKPHFLCRLEDDIRILKVADDGSNVIWYHEEGKYLNIHMLKNGLPVKIGKITKPEGYSSVFTDFFDHDKSFILFGPGCPQALLSVNGRIEEIVLPGVKSGAGYCDAYGREPDSDDDGISEFYFEILEDEKEPAESLFRMTQDGELELVLSDVERDDDWFPHYPRYRIADGKVYYINRNGDFCQAGLRKGTEAVKITTEASRFYLPEGGRYAYILKAGKLYCWKLSDSDFTLELITDHFGNNDTLYITDRDHTVYYIDRKERRNPEDREDRKGGTLYRYTVGGGPVKIAENILMGNTNGEKNMSADKPVMLQYSADMDAHILVKAGIVTEDKFQALMDHVILF